ncbi:hypothetical protein B4W73_11855 [Staphylococcus delphini]|uniref:type II toxin-antitoxin system PemK/MazF family toxin n=1 Tax=Staphylococcus delphini TaxID=53344 RepID=UPI000BBC2270|nr:type II toxin-antitoxin system PemK/MazF family toxin [Staphylococcus delphini]PCF70945.1 hypothetical protein B4W73_11855 [Staphylococcus delphini]
MEEIKNERLLKATKNFEEVCNSRSFKFQYLDDWLYTKSSILKKEIKTNRKNEFKVYPRGTIVYAKFGVNIGSEFSGNHFCVVLNKKDHKRNELVTVVPLTSKNTNFSLLLPENIVEKALEKMEKDSNSLRNDLKKLVKTHKSYIDTEDINPELETELETELEIELGTMEKNYAELIKIIERYERFMGKQTYAIPSQISTISKKRISTINKYDPTGYISFDKSTLKVIEDYIKVNLLT